MSVNAEGKVEVSPNADAELKENHSYYLQTEKGLSLFAAHKDLIKAVNQFLSIAPGIDAQRVQQFIHGLGKKVELSEVDYDRLANMGR